MLNELLYNALVNVYKDVHVSNEGQHATITPVGSSWSDWTVLQEDEHGEQYIINCPFCKDTKKHLYISYLSYLRPFLNGMPLRIGALRAHCFRNNCLKDPDNVFELGRQIGFGMALVGDGLQHCCDFNCDEPSEDSTPRYQLSSELSLDGLKTWIPDWNVIDSNTDTVIMEYLQARRVTADDIRWLNIGWGPIRSPRSHRYLNNGLPFVLFPIVNNKKLVGVQARCPDKYMTEDQPKYYFHPGCRKQTILFNLDEARNFGVAVVSEGIFDVLSIGKPGVCCFGHTPSVAQMRLLETFENGVIFLPDTDVRPDLNTINIAKNCAQKLQLKHQFNMGVHVVVLPRKDAGELTRQQVWQTILNQVPNEMQDFLLAKVVGKL